MVTNPHARLSEIRELMNRPCPYPSQSSESEQTSWIELEILDGKVAGEILNVLSGGKVQVASVRDTLRDLRDHPEHRADWEAWYDLLADACVLLISLAGDKSTSMCGWSCCSPNLREVLPPAEPTGLCVVR